MSKSTRRTLIVLAIVGVGLIALCGPWAKLFYHGDGNLSDSTALNRPRYVIRFHEIPIFQTGKYQYHFRGLPHEEFTLMLYVNGKPEWPNEELKSLQTEIEAVLLDSHGTDACASSRLRSGTLPALNDPDSVWVLSGNPRGAVFWHSQCHNFQARRRQSYELTIRVMRADPRAERIFVTPSLEGGGIEFP